MSFVTKFAICSAMLLTSVVQLFAADAPAVKTTAWTWPAYIVIPLIAIAGLYVSGVVRKARRGARPQLLPVACFASGWLSLVVALDSPVHEISEQLFWVHMTQHEILMLISAPLLVLGRPIAPLLFAFPGKSRVYISGLRRLPLLKRTWTAISAPFAAWLLSGLALWIWHAPVFFTAALQSDVVHALQHICFLGTALLFWWALLHNHAGRLGYGGAILYVFTTAIHTSVLGAWLTFSPRVWYAPYANTAPLWGLTALQDQQIGGLIMWIPAGTLLTVAALLLLGKWLKHSDVRWEYTQAAALIRASQGVAK